MVGEAGVRWLPVHDDVSSSRDVLALVQQGKNLA